MRKQWFANNDTPEIAEWKSQTNKFIHSLVVQTEGQRLHYYITHLRKKDFLDKHRIITLESETCFIYLTRRHFFIPRNSNDLCQF